MGKSDSTQKGWMRYPPVSGTSLSEENARGVWYCVSLVKCWEWGKRKSTKAVAVKSLAMLISPVFWLRSISDPSLLATYL